MAEFIEKIRVPVRVSQPGQKPVEGFFSLLPLAELHSGPETILERLNSRERVVPFQRAEDGVVLLLGRRALQWVLAGTEVERRLVYPSIFRVTREEKVAIRFTGGGEMDGIIQMELPEDVNRASDFLNSGDDFFPLATPGGVFLVNKDCVACTLVHRGAPRRVVAGGKAAA